MWVNGFKITEKAKAIISTKIHDTQVIGLMIKSTDMEDRFIQIWNMKEIGCKVKEMGQEL